jgi:dTMP kinase
VGDCRVPVVICGELRSPIADMLRNLVHRGCSPFLKTFLFAADRAWAYEEECLPVLGRGGLVLWDRYVDSALAYRAVEFLRVSSEIDLDFVREINRPFQDPNLTVYLDISADTSADRAEKTAIPTPQAYDRAFLDAVRAQYLRLAHEKGYSVVDGERSPESVASEVSQIIRQTFKELFK